MSAGPFREALGETAERYDVLLTHLAVIRDVVHLARSAASFDELCATLAERLVAGLGYERVSVVVVRDGAATIVANASQATRLSGEPSVASPMLRTLAEDVIGARRLVRWSDEGIGARRPVPAGLEGAIIGWPLVVGGECIGAIVCEELVVTEWDLARQRALELIAEIIDQVVTLADVRLSMTSIQRELESELGTSRTRLTDQEETLRAQSDRISQLANALIASSQVKDHFLGLMSHELRTPLSVILGFGSILSDGLAGPVTSEQGEHLDRILSNGRHLNQLIDDMLFFVDAETTTIAPQSEPVDLSAVLRDVAQALPDIARAGAPAFSVTIASDAAVLRSDVGLLRRVLFHLLHNAFKFTEYGSVRVEATRGAGAVEIRITDTGIGIPAEHLRRIFELFQQGDDTHARKREGIGLGLNLAHACLVLLRGRCRLVAVPEGGTRVELWIPDGHPARAASSTAARADAVELAATEAALIGVARDGAEVIAMARRATAMAAVPYLDGTPPAPSAGPKRAS